MNSRRRRDDGFNDVSIVHAIFHPIRFFRRMLKDGSGDSRSSYSERSPLGNLFAFLTLPFRFFVACVIFLVQAWTTSRNGFAFVRSLPAILMATGMLAAFWAINYRHEKTILQTDARYQLAMVESPENPEYAEMYALKLVEFRPDEIEYKYKLALAQERSGKLQSARHIMRKLAGEDSSGLPAAHVWLARDYAVRTDHGLTEDEREVESVKHYELALLEEPRNIMALLGMADVFEKKGDLETALSYLDRVTKQELVSLIQLQIIPKIIDMQQQLGKDREAKASLRRQITRITPIARRNPDLIEVWVVLVRCATMLKDYELASEIVNDGYQIAKSPQVRENLVRLLANVSIVQADEITTIDDKENYKKRLYSLCDAIKTNPRSRDAYVRLIEYAAPQTLQDEKAIWLRDSILGCPNPAVIHVILGMQDIKSGDFVQGQKHWRIADQQFELSQYIVNNMIELAVSDRPDDFGNLLDMITVAMELFPDQATLYQTRGMYYKKQGQYAEAVKDLNYTVEKIPNLISARQLLLESYKSLGDQENVARVQTDIDRMVNELDDEQRKMVEAFLKTAEEANSKEAEGSQ